MRIPTMIMTALLLHCMIMPSMAQARLKDTDMAQAGFFSVEDNNQRKTCHTADSTATIYQQLGNLFGNKLYSYLLEYEAFVSLQDIAINVLDEEIVVSYQDQNYCRLETERQ